MKSVLGKIYKLAFRINPAYFILVILQALITSAISLFNALYISYIIELVTQYEFSEAAKRVIFLILLDLMLNFVLKLLDKYIYYQNEITSIKIFEKLVIHITKVEYQNVENAHYQEVIQNAKFGIYSQDALSTSLNLTKRILSSIITIITLISSIAIMEPIILLVIGIGFIITIIINNISYKKAMKLYKEIVPNNRKMSYFEGCLVSPEHQKDLRLYSLKDMLQGHTETFFNKFQDDYIGLCKKQGIFSAISSFVNYLQLGIIYLITAYKSFLSTTISVASFTLQINLATNLFSSLNSGYASFTELITFRNFLKPIAELLELEEASSLATEELKDVNTIEFRDVSFKYPNTDITILDKVSFKINKGEKIALVGLNGAGKSTIVKLICRLYDNYEGDILINNKSIKEYNIDSYYEAISTVFQDYGLFAVSLKDNILLGKDKDLTNILDELGLTEVIDKLPDKIDSNYTKAFSENGVELSGGETQKIAIARALVRNSSFLILDEPTSALDPIAEANIYSNFKDLADNKTAIYISHRLASAIFCDKVLVLDGGKIVDFAPHNTLMKKKDSLYAKLFNLQKENYKLD